MKKVIGWLLVFLIISGCASVAVKSGTPDPIQKIKALALTGKVDPDDPNRIMKFWTAEDATYMAGYDKAKGEIAWAERWNDKGVINIALMTYIESTSAYKLLIRDANGDKEKELTAEQGIRLAKLFLEDLKEIKVKVPACL